MTTTTRSDDIIEGSGAQAVAKLCNIDISRIVPTPPKRFIDISAVIRHIETSPPSSVLIRRQLMRFVPCKNRIRDYQWTSASHCASSASGGFIVAPCGAGKTLIGLLIAILRGGRFIVLTTRYTDQWYDTLSRFFEPFGHVHIVVYGTTETSLHKIPDVVIATYAAFNGRSKTTHLRLLKHIPYTTLILDEAHTAASASNLAMIERIRTLRAYALTATKVREDSELEKLEKMIGPSLITIQRGALVTAGQVADVQCINLKIPYTTDLESALGRPTALALHPHKIQVLQSALKHMTKQNHKTLVFCDDLFCLEWTYSILKSSGPVIGRISMRTPYKLREGLIREFSNAKNAAILFISRTGDEALDVPNASAAIVFWNHWGSRRQIVQRIGRISRIGASNASTPVFLVLLSDDAKELEVSNHREAYLEEHGYEVHTFEQETTPYGTTLRTNTTTYMLRIVETYKKYHT